MSEELQPTVRVIFLEDTSLEQCTYLAVFTGHEFLRFLLVDGYALVQASLGLQVLDYRQVRGLVRPLRCVIHVGSPASPRPLDSKMTVDSVGSQQGQSSSQKMANTSKRNYFHSYGTYGTYG